jgi:hypothetical protein
MKYNAKFVFYTAKLAKKVKLGTNRALYRTAGLIRTSERRIIRVKPGSKPGKPGSPPHAHTAGGLRIVEFHVFGNSAIVGPKKFPRSNWWNQPVTHMHEFGGQFISKKGLLANYPQRPYASLVLKRLMEKGKIPKQFGVTIAETL